MSCCWKTFRFRYCPTCQSNTSCDINHIDCIAVPTIAVTVSKRIVYFAHIFRCTYQCIEWYFLPYALIINRTYCLHIHIVYCSSSKTCQCIRRSCFYRNFSSSSFNIESFGTIFENPSSFFTTSKPSYRCRCYINIVNSQTCRPLTCCHWRSSICESSLWKEGTIANIIIVTANSSIWCLAYTIPRWRIIRTGRCLQDTYHKIISTFVFIRCCQINLHHTVAYSKSARIHFCHTGIVWCSAWKSCCSCLANINLKSCITPVYWSWRAVEFKLINRSI